MGGTDQRPLVRISLATTREQAIALQGWELLASGEELEALPHYTVSELIGAAVETAGGASLGIVVDVIQSPAHELLEFATPSGRRHLVPLVDELVTLDVDRHVVRVRDGLLAEDAGE